MTTKTDRLEMRLSAEQKELLERAAAITGQPLTGFALSHLLERAQEIMDRYQKTVLSRRDQECFLSILESDEVQAPALKEAIRRHKSRRG